MKHKKKQNKTKQIKKNKNKNKNKNERNTAQKTKKNWIWIVLEDIKLPQVGKLKCTEIIIYFKQKMTMLILDLSVVLPEN